MPRRDLSCLITQLCIYQIGLGDSVNYNFKNYLVLINYIKGETDAKGYTPESNRTILIDDNDNRIVCDDYKQLIIEDSN